MTRPTRSRRERLATCPAVLSTPPAVNAAITAWQHRVAATLARIATPWGCGCWLVADTDGDLVEVLCGAHEEKP